MIAFKDVQSTLVGLISARLTELEETTPALDGIAVVEHVGTQENENEAERSLREKGIAISVLVPIDGRATSQGAGRVVMDVSAPVLLEVNVEENNSTKNPDAAGMGIYELLEVVVKAVVNAARPTNENDRWGFEGFSLDTADAGLFRIALTFTKRCVL